MNGDAGSILHKTLWSCLKQTDVILDLRFLNSVSLLSSSSEVGFMHCVCIYGTCVSVRVGVHMCMRDGVRCHGNRHMVMITRQEEGQSQRAGKRRRFCHVKFFKWTLNVPYQQTSTAGSRPSAAGPDIYWTEMSHGLLLFRMEGQTIRHFSASQRVCHCNMSDLRVQIIVRYFVFLFLILAAVNLCCQSLSGILIRAEINGQKYRQTFSGCWIFCLI